MRMDRCRMVMDFHCCQSLRIVSSLRFSRPARRWKRPGAIQSPVRMEMRLSTDFTPGVSRAISTTRLVWAISRV